MLVLALALLPGCASMLTRNYVSVAPHNQFSDFEPDSSILRAESYQGLVNAIVYLVSQRAEEGIIRLYNYTGDVETDLSGACLEVTQEDPLGAYAVDYMKYDVARIVSYYEANLQITYRRTPQQMESIVSVTGSSAIRDEIRQALKEFSPEVVLRVSYFVEEEDYIRRLIWEAYYDTPQAALGLSQADVAIYPQSGFQRIVEITLTYPDTAENLAAMQKELTQAATELLTRIQPTGQPSIPTLEQGLRRKVVYIEDPGEGYRTPYAALVKGRANSEGIALAFLLLCQLEEVEGLVVYGARNDEPCYWNMVQTPEGWRHTWPLWETDSLRTDSAMTEAGYTWDTEAYPACTEPAAEGEKTAS